MFIINYIFALMDPKILSLIKDCINLQKYSFYKFLQNDLPRNKRQLEGLEKLFTLFFPVIYSSVKKVEYEDYRVIMPEVLNIEELRKHHKSYECKIELKLKFTIENKIFEKWIFFCNLPVITDDNCFIINGLK